MIMDYEPYKPYLEDYLTGVAHSRPSKGADMFICPLCGSGTGANHTGALKLYRDENKWYCHVCKAHGDVFDLCRMYEGYSDDPKGKAQAAQRIEELYGRPGKANSKPKQPQPVKPSVTQETQKAPEAAPAQVTDYTADIKRFEEALQRSPEALAYLQGRGFTPATIARFHLGYDAKRNAITIPYNQQGTYYAERYITPKEGQNPHYKLNGIPCPLFNPAALYSSDVVFVVESPLCAISITQEGGAAVALSGMGDGKLLLKQLQKKTTNAAIVLCLDNDPHVLDGHGKWKDEKIRDTTKKLADAIEALGQGLIVIPDGTAAIMGEETNKDAEEYRKDPNDVLRYSGAAALREAVQQFTDNVRQARKEALQEAEAERQERTGAGLIDSFLQEVQTRKYEPMPTGIADIDKALSGGFTRQQLVILGAAPGAGKTALAQWIFEGMATRGTPCVFVNLEMSRAQLLARSISRIAARQGNHIKPLEVLQGYKWDNAQQATILAAAYEYKTKIAPCFIMNPPEVTSSLDTITAYMEAEAQRAEAAGHAAPLVVIDYLQLITGDAREDTAAVIKRAVFAFKSYAMKHNTLVFVIIAHNRQANSTGKVTMEAARDTSAIEYSADIQLGLTFTKAVEKKKGIDGGKTTTTYRNIEDLTDEEKKFVTLKILKGRFGGRDTGVDLHFDGATMTYTQVVKNEAPTTGTGKRNRY